MLTFCPDSGVSPNRDLKQRVWCCCWSRQPACRNVAPDMHRSQELCTRCLFQLRSGCFGQATWSPHGSLPLFSGTGIDTQGCSETNSISRQELFQYSAIRGYNCRQGGEEFVLTAVILHYYLPFSTSKYYRLVFQHFLSQGCVGSAWFLGYDSVFFLAQDERVPLETLFTCLICVLSLYNSLSSIVLFFIGVFLMDA